MSVDTWKLILASFICNFLNTIIQFVNVKRYNLVFGISDFYINVLLMLLGKATSISLSVLPMNIMMMEVVPANIEASMFAIIGAIISLSTDWLGEVVGGFICDWYEITTANKTNFYKAIEFKMVVILLSIALI